jgi:hypothetical protein
MTECPMSAEQARDLTYWRHLVQTNIRNVTPEQALSIAQMCQDAERKGENCGVWHQSARYFGHRCNCVPCRREQRAA